MRTVQIGLLILVLFVQSTGFAQAETGRPCDVIVVGAGLSGLSAALEAARNGANVTVIEMWSVFGGTSIMSGGGMSIVGTPYQKQRGIEDSPDLAFDDFVRWGEDVNEQWVRYYVNNSRTEIYDWLTKMGMEFVHLAGPAGNSVKRIHFPPGAGVGLLVPIFQECARCPNIQFEWNVRAKELIVENGSVVGLRCEQLRSGKEMEFRSKAVILATGGFQSNLNMIRQFWPKNLPVPDRILTGSGKNSLGSGHKMAKKAGAAFHRIDHQWNYAYGLGDDSDPQGRRGFYVKHLTGIWVNADGKRFANELASAKFNLPALVRQKGGYYWAIFDEKNKNSMFVPIVNFHGFRDVKAENPQEQTICKISPQPGRTCRNYRPAAQNTD